MVDLTHKPGLGIFQNPVIFFSSKNRKLAVKERTLKQTRDAVDTQLQHYFEAAYWDPDKVFFDIGKGISQQLEVYRPGW